MERMILIYNDNSFRSFKYKANLLKNAVAQPAANATNGIQKMKQFLCH